MIFYPHFLDCVYCQKWYPFLRNIVDNAFTFHRFSSLTSMTWLWCSLPHLYIFLTTCEYSIGGNMFYILFEIVSLAIGMFITWKHFLKHDSIFIRNIQNLYFRRTLNYEHRLDLLKWINNHPHPNREKKRIPTFSAMYLLALIMVVILVKC